MATRKPASPQAAQSSPSAEAEVEATLPPAETEAASAEAPAAEGAALASAETAADSAEHTPRFHFFIIDAGWKSISAKVIRDNFHMIREFQNSDPLYILSAEQSIKLIRDNPDLIGKDPLILVHDLHAKGGRGESGYHGFRLCLGLIKDSRKALEALQQFLRFVQSHRRCDDIEKALRQRLQRAGFEGAIEVIREGAGELME